MENQVWRRQNQFLVVIFFESKQNPDQEIDCKENSRYGSVFASILVVVASVLVVGLGLLCVD